MKQVVTTGIVLSRTNFQEADRIITILTPDMGKIRLIAKGVRRSKSKMAGGIELFTIGDITYIPGRGDIGTLVSSRLKINFSNIVKDINRTMYGYEILKRIHKTTEDSVEDEYFELLQAALAGLDDGRVSLEVHETWFSMQLLKLTGHVPNLRTDTEGRPLSTDQKYIFSFDDMAFAQTGSEGSPRLAGAVDARLIKILRLSHAATTPVLIAQVKDAAELVDTALQLVKGMSNLYLVA